MTIFAAITAFLQAATAYFNLKAKTAYFDILEKFDSRLDKLDKQREGYRSQPNQDAQKRADDILDEIIEEKRKLEELKKTIQ